MQKTFLGLMFSFAISGPVHTYPYIFENEEFFLCFRNAISVRTERIRIAFARSNVNTKTVEIDGIPYRSWSLWCVKLSYSKTSVFVRRNENGKPTFSKTRLWRPVSKTCFLVPENVLTRGRTSPFSKISGCLWTGHWKQVLKSPSSSLS